MPRLSFYVFRGYRKRPKLLNGLTTPIKMLLSSKRILTWVGESVSIAKGKNIEMAKSVFYRSYRILMIGLDIIYMSINSKLIFIFRRSLSQKNEARTLLRRKCSKPFRFSGTFCKDFDHNKCYSEIMLNELM